MNIIFVSQCTKRALLTTRRVLDQFAERKGDCVWHAQLTEQALLEVRKLLSASARKNTAVCCHLVRRAGGTQVRWTVGAAHAFAADGNVPTRRSASKLLWRYGESSWRAHRLIRDVVTLSALTHDLGKATVFFQEKLRGTETTPNVIRHEWVSARLVQAFALNSQAGASTDDAWLKRGMEPSDWADSWTRNLQKDLLPCTSATDRTSLFTSLSDVPLAKLATWLTLTHHRLPQLAVSTAIEDAVPSRKAKPEAINATDLIDWEALAGPGWNEPRAAANGVKVSESSWAFAHGLPTVHASWSHDFARTCKRLDVEMLKPGRDSLCANPFVAHISRLCLMLADHSYSALSGPDKRRVQVKAAVKAVWANTTADRKCNQSLNEHLIGVSRLATSIAQVLPALSDALPGLQSGEQELRAATKLQKYEWQNDAARVAEECAVASRKAGAFVINVASTGRGKTLANARILAGFSPDGRVRGTFAMGLRSLTLQTGRALQQKLGLTDEDMVVRVGTEARELFEYGEAAHRAAKLGSESAAELAEEEFVHGASFVDLAQLPVLRHMGKAAGTFVAAPFAVCTIDHLTPATEGVRGGRQISPMLRLLTADLVLDEPDDFGLDDLPALTRLVHWAGLLGARVVLSSATLPPSMVVGLFQAYRTGRAAFNEATSGEPATTLPVCLWVDEFSAAAMQPDSAETFSAEHVRRMNTRAAAILAQEADNGPRHRGGMLAQDGWQGLSPEAVDSPETLAQWTLDAVRWQHDQHAQRPATGGPRVSVGLVRVANITSLVDTLRFWLQQARTMPENYRLHVCPYHSRFPLFLRSALERDLDTVLQRHDEQAFFRHPKVKLLLDAEPKNEHIFVVLGSPVTEVGRDHDYDWAVPEPSSMRSIIQLSGRVRRHRPPLADGPNVLVMPRNFRDVRGKRSGKGEFSGVYHSPGFEAKDAKGLHLKYHGTAHVFRESELAIINSIPRICESAGLTALGSTADRVTDYLSDLEHLRTREELLPKRALVNKSLRSKVTPSAPLNASSWWAQPAATWTGLLQQKTPFRRGVVEQDLVLLPDDNGRLYPHRLSSERGSVPQKALGKVEKESWKDAPALTPTVPQIGYWLQQDPDEELAALAEHFGMSALACARRFATVSVPKDGPWTWHPNCGVVAWTDEMGIAPLCAASRVASA